METVLQFVTISVKNVEFLSFLFINTIVLVLELLGFELKRGGSFRGNVQNPSLITVLCIEFRV